MAVDKGQESSIIYQVTYTEEKELKYREVYRSVNSVIVAF